MLWVQLAKCQTRNVRIRIPPSIYNHCSFLAVMSKSVWTTTRVQQRCRSGMYPEPELTLQLLTCLMMRTQSKKRIRLTKVWNKRKRWKKARRHYGQWVDETNWNCCASYWEQRRVVCVCHFWRHFILERYSVLQVISIVTGESTVCETTCSS